MLRQNGEEHATLRALKSEGRCQVAMEISEGREKVRRGERMEVRKIEREREVAVKRKAM